MSAFGISEPIKYIEHNSYFGPYINSYFNYLNIINKSSDQSRSVDFYDVDYGYPINSAIAQNNRDAINSWIDHAKSNGYTLIFADVVTQKLKNEENSISKLKNRQSFCEYIERRGSTCYSFVDYLDDVGIVDWNEVRWKLDGHLNFKGNELYADFLSKIYLKYN